MDAVEVVFLVIALFSVFGLLIGLLVVRDDDDDELLFESARR
jgi:hypothetical protein